MTENQPPNILWISLEDTSPQFGCYGDSLAETPNIDGLAADGRVYTEACSTAGVCAPSRASIITGRYQTTIGAHYMRTRAYEPRHTKSSNTLFFRTISLRNSLSGVPEGSRILLYQQLEY
nr:sulfatase-like hydrolase/transferase [Halococcus sp. IIIV-5B]